MKRYLERFDFVGGDGEVAFFRGQKMTCYNNYYPFGVLAKDFEGISFEPITILYGGNGSGKSTVLNIIAQRLSIARRAACNRSSFFEEYVEMCEETFSQKPPLCKILTSDDVFQNLFTLREKNRFIDERRERVLAGPEECDLHNATIPEKRHYYTDACDWLFQTKSAYVKKRVEQNLIGKSNGETALDFFANEIQEPGLYLLDEPENSLSAAYQIELAKFLFDAVRFFGAQLVIATHSPFLLSIPGAKIYNLDTAPVSVTYDWTSLDNMRSFYDFFKGYQADFEKHNEH